MAKEYYDVSFRTYFNDRIKPVIFHGQETSPLYIQVTYDRKTIFFKSYYFDLFARQKYEFLGTTISQIDKLEGEVIDFFVKMHYREFDLNRLLRQYKLIGQDVLDNFDGPFKMWLSSYLKKQGLPGLAILLEYVPDEVCGIQVWDDLKKILDPEMFGEMEETAMHMGPYMPLATYVRHTSPTGPFCLPLHVWAGEEKRIEIENFIDERFYMVDFGKIIWTIRQSLYPDGF